MVLFPTNPPHAPNLHSPIRFINIKVCGQRPLEDDPNVHDARLTSMQSVFRENTIEFVRRLLNCSAIFRLEPYLG